MANKKISGLTNSLTKSTVATNDLTVVVDTSASESKKMTYGELMSPIDSVFRVAGSSDNTKLVAFEVDGLTTATTRTITVPDADLTLVGVATTQTLTNKTLTSPQINFSSNGVGDLIYRNGSGITDRLAIGSTDQILAVQGGVPTWIANPSATTATTSAAGIVELATTAETETGTDATRAVTPDGLHDMTTLAGAGWFLDEDTMSSDSATKTASQQSIKAYVDTNLGSSTNSTVNTSTGTRTYVTTQLHVDADLGWSITGTPAYHANGFSIAATTNARVNLTLLGRPDSYDNGVLFSSGIDCKIAYWFIPISASAGTTAAGAGDIWFFHGFTDATGSNSSVSDITSFSDRKAGFSHYNGKIYTLTADGSAVTATEVDATDDGQVKKHYLVAFTPTSVTFYINGTLVATHTTNIPVTQTLRVYWGGYDGSNNTVGFGLSNPVFSETLS